MQSYGPPKSWESKLWEFRDSHLEVVGQNTIWMWALWKSTKCTRKGEGGDFPQVWAVVSLVNPNLPLVHPSTKNVQTTH